MDPLASALARAERDVIVNLDYTPVSMAKRYASFARQGRPSSLEYSYRAESAPAAVELYHDSGDYVSYLQAENLVQAFKDHPEYSQWCTKHLH